MHERACPPIYVPVYHGTDTQYFVHDMVCHDGGRSRAPDFRGLGASPNAVWHLFFVFLTPSARADEKAGGVVCAVGLAARDGVSRMLVLGADASEEIFSDRRRV